MGPSKNRKHFSHPVEFLIIVWTSTNSFTKCLINKKLKRDIVSGASHTNIKGRVPASLIECTP